jgi:hypothetical protein
MPELIATQSAGIAALRQFARDGQLYAIFDACDEPRVPVKMRELGDDGCSLYSGSSALELSAIAPYLARVDSALLDWTCTSLWTAPWGIFAATAAPLDELRAHFRKCLIVDAPDNDRWYFRFYDPRVLARFLPTCDAPQLAHFFGPIDAFGWVDLENYGVTLARRSWYDGAAPPLPRITYRKVAR